MDANVVVNIGSRWIYTAGVRHFMLNHYVSRTQRSKSVFERAKKSLPSGVSYSIRYFAPYPFYTVKAEGSKLYDIDGNEYVDFWLGHTALILGHSHPTIVKAVTEQLAKGSHFGTSHELEIELAEQIADMIPSVTMTRFTNSGTEANMYAVRLARAYTGRLKIAKFEGGWHGGYDALQKGVKHPFDVPESAGLTAASQRDTIVLPFNDLEGVMRKLRNEDVACVTVEPVLGAGGCIPADKDFLKGLRELCHQKGILLVFDEVITGFRLASGGAQEYCGVTPDLTVFGKILGGGFPIGAFCGPHDIMERMDTTLFQRPHYSFHGGTFAANPVSMAAGLAILKTLKDGRLIRRLNKEGQEIRIQLREIFETNGVDVQITGAGSLLNVHFAKEEITNSCQAWEADKDSQYDYHFDLICHGVFFLPQHTGALCAAHSEEDYERLFAKTEAFAKRLRAGQTGH